jgi:uncharacterized repeat protein (TIGR01451 family)
MRDGLIHYLCSTLPGESAGERGGRPEGVRVDPSESARGGRAKTAASGLGGRRTGALWALLALLWALLAPLGAFGAVQGDLIVNKASFLVDGIAQASASVSTSVVLRTSSTIEFLKYAAPSSDGTPTPGASQLSVSETLYRTASDPAAPFAAEPRPIPLGASSPLDLNTPVPLVHADAYHAGEPIFIKVTDLDQNLDRTARETILVTIVNSSTLETEVLRLTETGPDSGVFVGYIGSEDSTIVPGSGSYNGVIPVTQGNPLTARYVDVADGSDSSAAAVVVDPLGIVFDSSTGKPLDGATVILFDVTANKTATVYGDDGVAIFPATVVTGSVPRDSSGRLYNYPPGGFRFPFITPGRYQLRVTPPTGYLVPSSASNAALAALPGGPFTIVTGSRGETFAVNPGPSLRIDIPADLPSGKLWIQKSAGKSQVASGDFLPYQINVQNNDQALTMAAVVVTDRLPLGFRYRKGSSKIGEVQAADPAISADGRTLVFAIGDLAPRASAQLQYVVEVSAGAALGFAINTASAASGPLASNVASAQVEVRSDFLASRSIIMGRVFNGSCSEDGSDPDLGVAGVRIYLEDGTFVDTDKTGMFHFEGVTPRTHVVQLDLDSLPAGYAALPCEQNSRFAGRAYSQFVEMQGGTMWRADFHLARGKQSATPGEHQAKAPAPEETAGEAGDGETGPAVGLELKSSLKGEKLVEYQARLWGGAQKLTGKSLSVTLPSGVVYQPKSCELDGAPQGEPVQDGASLSFPLADSDGEWTRTLRFSAKLAAAGDQGDLLTRAVLNFDSAAGARLKTPEADNVLERVRSKGRLGMPEIVLHPHFPTLGTELTAEDRATLDELALMLSVLDIDRISVTGHTDNVRIAPRHRRLFQNNKALSVGRAASVGRYLREKLHLTPEKIEYAGFGEAKPVASNGSGEGRAQNRRVEIRVLAARTVEKDQLGVKKGQSGQQQVVVARAASLPAPSGKKGDPPAAAKTAEPETAAVPAGEQGIKDELGVLSPADGSILIYPINGVRVCLLSTLTPRLTVDGKEVPADRIGFTMKDQKSGKSLYSYIGVDFGAQGEHTALIEGLDPFGNARFSKSVKLTRSGAVASLRLKSAQGNIADGKTPVRLQLEFLDAAGKVIPGAGDLEIRDGELRPPKIEGLLAEAKPGQYPVVHVDAQGNALFQPVTRSGLYRLILGINGVKLETETYLKPALRDWILVGVAEGTAGYNTLSGHMENLQGAGVDDKLFENDRVAFYAKGTVKGEWLMTAAYDSAKSSGSTGNGLFQTIDPNTYYTLYGDGSNQQYDAASTKKLYLKIERDQFYALYGDYDTGLTVTELSRYSRRLNGVKTELHGKNLELTAFGSQSGQSYVKDEIQGDGTSGIYHLSRKGIVINSEAITVQVRDQIRSEILITSRTMSRFTDYSIDYDSGTLLFKEPIYNRDDQSHLIYIVAEYETQSGGASAITAGGRAGVKLLDDRVKAGISYIHEGQVSSKGDSLGVDTTLKLAEGMVFKGEAARTQTNFGTPVSGNAYLAELTERTAKLDSRVYFREIGTGFGLGQQQATELGTRKLGAEAGYKLTDSITTNLQGNRQYNLSTGAIGDLVEARANYNAGNYGATLGLRYASDLLGDGTRNTSDQLSVGANWLTLDKKLNLKVTRDQSIGGNSNLDFPTRTTLGADYKLTEKVSVFGQQEFTDGASSKTNSTRGGLKTNPWTGGTVNSSVERNLTENEDRVLALFGLKQTWKPSQRWTVDAGLDRSQTIRQRYLFNVNVPPASGGGEDFTAVSLGAEYKQVKWTWNGRVEIRRAASEDKWGVITAVLGEPKEGWGWSARLQLFDTQGTTQDSMNGDLRLGLVYRPLKTRWIILDRLDLLVDSMTTNPNSTDATGTTITAGSTGSRDRRLVNNLNANYKPNQRTQISLQYGAKYVLETLDGDQYAGYTDLIGVEGRYDITTKWDLGVRGSLLHSWSNGQALSSTGLSVGYNIVENAWLGLGYNLTGFSDKDFSESNYSAQGPYMKFRFKFDQNSVKDAVKWINL